MEDLFNKKASLASSETTKRKKRTTPTKTNFSEPESFDKAIVQLENLVEKLESGETPLEESIEIYKQARELATWCYNRLNKVRGELLKLGVDEDGKFTLDEIPSVE